MPTLDDAKRFAANTKYDKALDTAAEVLRDSQDAGPEEKANIYIFLGACYTALDHHPEAKYCYRSAQTLFPEHPKIRIALAGLDAWETSVPVELAGIVGETFESAPASAGASPAEDARSPSASPPPRRVEERIHTEPKDPWENAFPDDATTNNNSSGFWKWLVVLIVFAAIVWIVYMVAFFE